MAPSALRHTAGDSEEMKATRLGFFERIVPDEKMPLQHVIRTYGDSRGQVWFLGTTGAVRYNGEEYFYYKSEFDNPNSLPSPWVECIAEDPDGNIWLGTSGGLCRYDPDQDSIFRIPLKYPHNKATSSTNITAIHCDADGTVWYADAFGLHRYRPKRGEDVFYDFFGEEKNYHKITWIERTKPGELRISALQYGLNIFEESSGRFERLRLLEDGKEISGFNAIRTLVLSDGSEWLSTWGHGLLRLGQRNGNLQQVNRFVWYAKNLDYRYNIATGCCEIPGDDGKPTIAFASEDAGLGFFNPQNGQFRFQTYHREVPTSLNQNTATWIANTGGILWISTYNGVGRYDLNRQQFVTHHFELNSMTRKTGYNRAAFDKVVADPEQQGVYWIITEQGVLGEWNTETGLVRYYYTHFQGKPNRFVFMNVLVCQNGKLYLSAQHHTEVFDLKSRRFLARHDLMGQGYNALIPSGSTDLIACAWNGAYIFNTETGRRKPISLPFQDVNYCHITSDSLWVFVSGVDGVCLYNPKGNAFRHYSINKQGSGYFPLAGAYSACSDDSGRIWVASPGGIAYSDKNGSAWKMYNPGFNGYDNWVNHAVFDGKNHVWFNTRNGILKVDYRNLEASLLRKSYGFVNMDIRRMSLTADSFLMFSAEDLIYQYDIRGQAQAQTQARVQLESMHVNGYKRPRRSFDSLELPHDSNSVSLRFWCSGFPPAEQLAYEVKLSDEEGRSVISDKAEADFSYLKPGKYRLMVSAASRNREWQARPLQMLISIRPPWYNSNWFYTLSGAAVLLFTYLLFRWRVQRIRQVAEERNKIERTIAELEMKTLRAQMNPHFIFNSLNSIQRYILSNRAIEASDYLARFSRMIRMVLENSIDSTTTLEQEKELLTNYLELEKLRTGNKFEFSVYMDPALSIHSRIPSMLAQPYLENAIWHGITPLTEPGFIRLQYQDAGTYCICIIDDNGVGRKSGTEYRKAQHISRGLEITRQRLALLLNDRERAVEIIDKHNPDGSPAGTLVKIRIPLYEPAVYTG
jgi:ligand-binding sensor domain-containing protein